MGKSYKNIIAALGIAILGFTFSGCGLFKKGGKCLECPKWSINGVTPSMPDPGSGALFQ
ncbi:MAG: hypothetical protein JKY52_13365 [Flavobacteriales bacterium]|nr:hypothetical protein [Flavobacteriales bacterium]